MIVYNKMILYTHTRIGADCRYSSMVEYLPGMLKGLVSSLAQKKEGRGARGRERRLNQSLVINRLVFHLFVKYFSMGVQSQYLSDFLELT